MHDRRDNIDGIVLVTEDAEHFLNQRQLADYKKHREKLIKWMLNLGKVPKKAEGYAWDTVRSRSYKLDKFYRWVWKEEDGYTLNVTPAHADDYTQELVYGDTGNAHKADVHKSIKTLFKWQNWEKDEEIDWEPKISFTNGSSATHQPRDFLSDRERRLIKEATLEYGSIPHYNSITPEERDKWKIHLAQRLEKPKDEIDPQDFERANGWKYPSIVWATMDAGFRPKEVGRAKVSWLDLENDLFRIPKEESTKNKDNWTVAVSERTANMLRHWVSERENYEKYRGSDALWLTKYGNPYSSQSLNRLLDRLCETAGIPEQRGMTWYSIRHSVGTKMNEDQGPGAVQQQLRQKSYEMAIRYDQSPPGKRRETIDSWD
ncbi:integrase [Halobacteriales archaeon QH_6_64_20]|nr:MAG: integrase [Halobacteriales archaeon QH_6_64_20]